MSAHLEIRDVSRNFRGLQVLQGVTLAVPERTITGLIGPNGAGKSTLFNIVSGFLRPSAGEIVYEGRNVTRASVQERSRAGLVRTFQTPQVFGHLTVHENLACGFFKRGRSGLVEALLRLPSVRRELADARAAADEACAAFGLGPVRDRPAGDLPAGQQRLVELARAAVGEPRLLCLDEPSSGLSAAEIVDLTRALHRLHESGITILLVSHDMELMDVCSSIHVLCFGEIIASGSMSALKADPRVREAYLGM